MIVMSYCAWESLSPTALRGIAENHKVVIICDINCGCKDCEKRSRGQIPVGHQFTEC